MATIQTADKPVNYTAAQEQIIRDLFATKGAPLDFADCQTLATDPAMFDTDGGERKPRSIAAKITRMDDVEYARKVATSKDGSAVTRKSDLVEEIAKLAGVAASKLDGMDKAPKLALVTLREAFANAA